MKQLQISGRNRLADPVKAYDLGAFGGLLDFDFDQRLASNFKSDILTLLMGYYNE